MDKCIQVVAFCGQAILSETGDVMFMSEYQHTVDTKGRLIIPAKFREEIGDQFYLTRGLDGCLYLFPENEWKDFEMQLRQLPVTFNKDARQFVRFFTIGGSKGQFDKQGRVLIPQTLRTFAKIKKDVFVAGNLNKIEIWSKERWDEMNSFDNMDSIAENLEKLGFNF